MRNIVGIISILFGVICTIVALMHRSTVPADATNLYGPLVGIGIVVVFFGVSSLVSRRKLILSLTFLVALVATILALIGGHALILWYAVFTVLMFGALLLRNRARGTYLRGDSSGQSIFGEAADRRQRVGAGIMLVATTISVFAYGLIGALDNLDIQTSRAPIFSFLLALAIGAVALSILIVFKPWRALAWVQVAGAVVAVGASLLLGFHGLGWLTVLILLVPLAVSLFSARMLIRR